MKKDSTKILESVTMRTLFDIGDKQRPNYSLLGGDFGEVIFLYIASKHGLCSIDNADNALDSILSAIKKHPVIGTYCNGLAGLCVGLKWLQNAGFIDGVLESLSVYDTILSHKLRLMLQSNLDFLHGAIGIGLYFVDMATENTNALAQVKLVLHHLNSLCSRNSKGGIYWKYPDRYGVMEENLSLSHGISSTTLFLTRAYKVLDEDNKKICIKLLRGIAEYMKSYLRNPEELGCYTPMPSNGAKSRLGWCYGDMGTSVAFRAIGDTLQDESLRNLSYEIAVYTAVHRKDLKEDFVFDACQCHGASGIAHYFRNCSVYYNDPLFDEAFERWRDITLNMYGMIDGEHMFGNFRYDDMRKHKSLGILEGDTGVALTLMGETTLLDNLLLYEY
ncbi:MAG: hypothetical protein NC453_18220 [Muribaculum sp.]|nr:hypothetical protein [Muribaculum sp.]